jgi:HlyD family secretion protein
MAEMSSKQWLIAGALLVAVIAAVVIWQRWPRNELGDGFASGNGRIETTEYDIATKQAGRIAKVLVAEGDMVKPANFWLKWTVRVGSRFAAGRGGAQTGARRQESSVGRRNSARERYPSSARGGEPTGKRN